MVISFCKGKCFLPKLPNGKLPSSNIPSGNISNILRLNSEVAGFRGSYDRNNQKI